MQIALQATGWLDAMMKQTSGPVAAGLFLIAGLYQWSSLKNICLTRCRSTQGFIEPVPCWRPHARVIHVCVNRRQTLPPVLPHGGMLPKAGAAGAAQTVEHLKRLTQ